MNQEQEAIKCYQNIALKLIEASPEHLNEVEISLEKKDQGVAIIQEVSIKPEDYFSPTEELLLAVRELQLMEEAKGKMFKSAKFKVFLKPDQKWSYDVKFNYDT